MYILLLNLKSYIGDQRIGYYRMVENGTASSVFLWSGRDLGDTKYYRYRENIGRLVITV